MSYETPSYRVEEQIGDVELRRYEPYVVAETRVSASLEQAGNRGFRLLAGYIFGGNTTAAGDSTKISMTTPVTQDRPGSGAATRCWSPSPILSAPPFRHPCPGSGSVGSGHVPQ